MRRWGAILCLIASAGLASGCFVLDEIDAGQEIMDKHRPGAHAEAEDAREPDAAEDGSTGLVARVKEWWNGLGNESSGSARPSSGPPPHPDDVLGTCDLGGSLTFMRKFDCQRKGGEFRPRKG